MRAFIWFAVLLGLAVVRVPETLGSAGLMREFCSGCTRSGQADKATRTAAQKKIDSQLLYALKQKRGETEGVPTDPIELDLDQKGRALIDITANVTPQVESQIRKLGGIILSSDERYHSLRARLVLEKLEALAALKDVSFIAPAAMPAFNRVKPN